MEIEKGNRKRCKSLSQFPQIQLNYMETTEVVEGLAGVSTAFVPNLAL